MDTTLVYALPFVILSLLFAGLVSYLLILRRKGRRRRRLPTSSELRSKGIPVIESTEFWVPGRMGDVVGIEIQPSPRMPFSFSTPKPPQREKGVRECQAI